MIKKHKGTVKSGRFVPADPLSFKLAFCALEGKPIYVTVSKETKRRSNNQNAYYHGVVIKLLAECTGYTPDEAHDAVRWLFLRVRRDGLPESVRSTTSLSTAEFETYMTDIRQWASVELGCYIPEPNEVE